MNRPIPHADDLEDTISDDLSWLHGEHYIQSGINIVWGGKRQDTFASSNGVWSSSKFCGCVQSIALYSCAGYQFDSNPWHLRIFSQYDFASGDHNPFDNTHRTFDTIYPIAHDRFGILDILGWQNIQSVRAGATMEPHPRWTITAQFLDFWLAAAQDAAYNSSGAAIARDSSGLDGKHIGVEADIYTWYELNRHLNIGAGFGEFRSGRFISITTNTPVYRGPYFSVNFKDAGRTEPH